MLLVGRSPASCAATSSSTTRLINANPASRMRWLTPSCNRSETEKLLIHLINGRKLGVSIRLARVFAENQPNAKWGFCTNQCSAWNCPYGEGFDEKGPGSDSLISR